MEQEEPVSGQLAQADLHVKEREGSLITEGIQCKKTWNLKKCKTIIVLSMTRETQHTVVPGNLSSYFSVTFKWGYQLKINMQSRQKNKGCV